MDAHVFRGLCDTLVPMLTGARLEKIQSPADDVFVFSFYTSARSGLPGPTPAPRQGKKHLVLRAGRKEPFLYVAQERPVAGCAPSAMVMRWRKHCAGRRVLSCVGDWTGRRLLLLFGACLPPAASSIPAVPILAAVPDVAEASFAPAAASETWLILDLREGPQLLLGKSPQLPEEPQWPEAQLLEDACKNWRQWPVITPALRRTLPLLDGLDQQALLADLEAGGGDAFVYGHGKNAELSAWPLPPELAAGREESVLESPLEAASLLGDALVLGNAAQKRRTGAALPHVREAARLERLLEKLLTEEARLRGMVAGQEKGLALQEILWRFAPDARLEQVETPHPDHPVIVLDKKISVRENMQVFFHQAARGRRGLSFMEQRRKDLQAQLAAVRATAQAVEDGAEAAPLPAGPKAERKGMALELPRGVQAFRSSEGFIILRGRDAKGNWAALRAGSPQDLWLHVEGGPGSHAIIRRHFSGQEIPESTLHEAASLAAVKSWQRDNLTALILCAEVRHVKPMRGAAPGTVRIDKVAQTFTVDIEQGVEERLAVSFDQGSAPPMRPALGKTKSFG